MSTAQQRSSPPCSHPLAQPQARWAACRTALPSAEPGTQRVAAFCLGNSADQAQQQGGKEATPQQHTALLILTLASASSSAFFLASSSSSDRGWACKHRTGPSEPERRASPAPRQADPVPGCACPFLTPHLLLPQRRILLLLRRPAGVSVLPKLGVFASARGQAPARGTPGTGPSSAPSSSSLAGSQPPAPRPLAFPARPPTRPGREGGSLQPLVPRSRPITTDLERLRSLSRRCPSFSRSRSFLFLSRSRSLCRRSLRAQSPVAAAANTGARPPARVPPRPRAGCAPTPPRGTGLPLPLPRTCQPTWTWSGTATGCPAAAPGTGAASCPCPGGSSCRAPGLGPGSASACDPPWPGTGPAPSSPPAPPPSAGAETLSGPEARPRCPRRQGEAPARPPRASWGSRARGPSRRAAPRGTEKRAGGGGEGARASHRTHRRRRHQASGPCAAAAILAGSLRNRAPPRGMPGRRVHCPGADSSQEALRGLAGTDSIGSAPTAPSRRRGNRPEGGPIGPASAARPAGKARAAARLAGKCSRGPGSAVGLTLCRLERAARGTPAPHPGVLLPALPPTLLPAQVTSLHLHNPPLLQRLLALHRQEALDTGCCYPLYFP